MKLDPGLKEDIKKYLKEKIRKESEKAILISTYKLSEDEKKLLVHRFPELKDREIVEQIDSSILAGVVIRYGSKIIDLSLSGKIKNLKQISYGTA